MGPRELIEELRPEIADARVLAAIAAVPRDRFVPRVDRARAWENRALPLPSGQSISQPLVVARMCEVLELRGGERVLEVGTGSGYHAAVLAALGARVWSVERHRSLATRARRTLAEAGVEGVTTILGDGALGYAEAAPYDAITVAATARERIPSALLEQLGPGGRLVAPLAADGEERLVLVRRGAGGRLERTALEGVRFVPLVEGSTWADPGTS